MVPFFSLKAYKKLTLTLSFGMCHDIILWQLKQWKNKDHALLINPEIFKYQYNQVLHCNKDYFS